MGGTARYVYKTLKLIRVQEKPLKIPYVLIHIIYYAQFVYKSWKKKHINAEYNLVCGSEFVFEAFLKLEQKNRVQEKT